jgi:hypothetical protein
MQPHRRHGYRAALGPPASPRVVADVTAAPGGAAEGSRAPFSGRILRVSSRGGGVRPSSAANLALTYSWRAGPSCSNAWINLRNRGPAQ